MSLYTYNNLYLFIVINKIKFISTLLLINIVILYLLRLIYTISLSFPTIAFRYFS